MKRFEVRPDFIQKKEPTKHGTLEGYHKSKCRCDPCQAVRSLSDLEKKRYLKEQKSLLRVRNDREALCQLMHENKLLRKILGRFISFQEIDQAYQLEERLKPPFE